MKRIKQIENSCRYCGLKQNTGEKRWFEKDCPANHRTLQKH